MRPRCLLKRTATSRTQQRYKYAKVLDDRKHPVRGPGRGAPPIQSALRLRVPREREQRSVSAELSGADARALRKFHGREKAQEAQGHSPLLRMLRPFEATLFFKPL